MTERYDCAEPYQRERGLRAAITAVTRGGLVVLPTDTVYGVGADAFLPRAVDALLTAKGRGRDMPVPVLVGSRRTLSGLTEDLPPAGQRLAEAFWPGGLTLVVRHVPHLAWDLGETKGTVAVRMPDHPVALDLLEATGPLAVSSANRSGQPAATTAAAAQEQLGDAVAVYLDAGPTATDAVPSTIVDLTGPLPQVLRAGALSVEQLRAVVPEVAAASP